MRTVNMREAKATLSRLVEAVESGTEQEIIIARNGRPAARIVPFKENSNGPRLGIAEGLFAVPEPSDELDQKITTLFNGE